MTTAAESEKFIIGLTNESGNIFSYIDLEPVYFNGTPAILSASPEILDALECTATEAERCANGLIAKGVSFEIVPTLGCRSMHVWHRLRRKDGKTVVEVDDVQKSVDYFLRVLEECGSGLFLAKADSEESFCVYTWTGDSEAARRYLTAKLAQGEVPFAVFLIYRGDDGNLHQKTNLIPSFLNWSLEHRAEVARQLHEQQFARLDEKKLKEVVVN